MSEITFDTLGNVWIKTDKQDSFGKGDNRKIKEQVIYVKHFIKPVEVRISFMPDAPSPYLIKFKRCKWTGNDLNRLMDRVEDNIRHVE